MIFCKYDRESYIAYFWASGDYFQEAIQVFKSNRLSYNPTKKTWESSPRRALRVIRDIRELLMPLEIDNSVLNQLSEDQYTFGKSELRKRRRVLRSELTPLGFVEGKEPYKDFQKTCVKRGISQNRLAWFLGMGTGKTPIATYTLNHLFEDDDIDRVLIVAPPEGIVNWRRELIRFSTFVHDEDDVTISSANWNRDFISASLETGTKVIICTYRHFLTVSDDYYKLNNPKRKAKKYRSPPIPFSTWGEKGRAIILDESHNVRNSRSRTAHVLHLHRDYFDYRYLLTGTPAPNEFGEMYSQIKFLDPAAVPRMHMDWLEEIADVGNRFSRYAVNYYRKDEVRKWEEAFRPLVMRYKTEDVLDLPAIYMKNTYVTLPEKQMNIYQQLVNQEINVLQEKDGYIIPKKLINRFPYISQSLDNPELLRGKIDADRNPTLANLVKGFRFAKNHGKLDVCKSIVEKHVKNGEKVILFDYHPHTLNQLHDVFSSYNPITIHGEGVFGVYNEGKEVSYIRDKAIEEFKSQDDRPLLIASSLVMSTSINLQEASIAVYFSRDYSYLNWSQSLARLHRIGQENRVIVYPLIFEGSLDIPLDNALSRKEDLDKSIFSREVKNKEVMSVDEWRSIFRGGNGA